MTTAVAKAKREACRSCDAPIIWCMSERGKSMPVNADPETGGNLLVGNPGGVQLLVAAEAEHAMTAVLVPADHCDDWPCDRPCPACDGEGEVRRDG